MNSSENEPSDEFLLMAGYAKLTPAQAKEVQSYAQSLLTAKLSELLEKLPTLQDLENPVQQSWKLGGTDQTSYRHGYHHAAEQSREAIEKMLEELK